MLQRKQLKNNDKILLFRNGRITMYLYIINNSIFLFDCCFSYCALMTFYHK